jgi:hypothetical protein
MYNNKRRNELKAVKRHTRCPSVNDSLEAADDYKNKKIKTIHLLFIMKYNNYEFSGLF